MDYRTISNLQERIAVLESRILHMTKPTVFTTDANTTGKVHTVQCQTYGASGELHNVRVIGNYGFASAALSGAVGQTVSSTGHNDNKLIIATHDPRYHPANLGQGDSCQHDHRNQKVLITQDGIHIEANSKTFITINGTTVIEVDGSKVAIKGDLEVSGKITASGDVVGAGISLQSHTHMENGKGSKTSLPA